MDHRGEGVMQGNRHAENQMRALTAVQDTTAALAIRLHLPQSFHEKSRQLVGIPSIKKALESAFEVFMLHSQLILPVRLALRELERLARLGPTVLLALDHA
jgi:hypothetical protein